MATARPEGAGLAVGDALPLSRSVFAEIARRVYALSGIVLKEHKRQMVCTRLTRRLKALGLETFEDYLSLLDGPAAGAEVGELINAITTNLTSFFREAHHFEHLLEDVVAPKIADGADRLRIWSAGCSTGEEPYTIQITLAEAGALSHRWDYKLLATDLDSAVLEKAAMGQYASERVKSIGAGRLSKSFSRIGEDSFAVKDSLKAAIRFKQLNLLDDWPFSGTFDAIFCRNVLIYFDNETKAGLIDRFAKALAPQGVLYLGHSESLLGEHPALKPCGRTTYRRRP